MLIKVARKFDSAHRLPAYNGKCRNLHGHSWKAVFVIEGARKKDGMVYDFKKLKEFLNKHLPDHMLLNDLVKNPTSENMAEYLFNRFSKLLKNNLKLCLTAVELWENEDCAVVFSKED